MRPPGSTSPLPINLVLLFPSILFLKNMKRVAVVWMDEYAEYVYQRQPSVRNIDPGNVTEMVELRKRLQCKPFKWFMEEIAFDIIPKYPTIELPPYASGQVGLLLLVAYVFYTFITIISHEQIVSKLPVIYLF